jgi:D-Tyr-tRNAtyr deacylase
MKAVIQRVTRASVQVDGKIVGKMTLDSVDRALTTQHHRTKPSDYMSRLRQTYDTTIFL